MPEIQLLSLFLFSVFLSVLSADRFIPSLESFIRLVLYSFVFLYVFLELNTLRDFDLWLKLSALSVSFVSILGIVQFFVQGSVFSNYLVFGEQPYDASTRGILIETVFGRPLIGSYGLFRHPNAFAGFLCINLLMMLFALILKKKRFLVVPILLGVLALIVTFSYITYVVLVLGAAAFIFIVFWQRAHIYSSVSGALNFWQKLFKSVRIRKLIVTFVFLLLSYYALSFYLLDKTPLTSVSRRGELLKASLVMFEDNFLFGVGLNNFTSHIDSYVSLFQGVRFTQPVHNIYVLLLTETGIFSLIFFVALLLYAVKKQTLSRVLSAAFVPLLCVFVLGSFDHYFLTMHQTQLLFWLTLGLASRQPF